MSSRTSSLDPTDEPRPSRDESARERLRALPQVQRLLEDADAVGLIEGHGRAAVVGALRRELARLRRQILIGNTVPIEASGAAHLLNRVRSTLRAADGRCLGRVINATGIVLHTNLGRAPVAAEAVRAMTGIAGSYANLEIDLATGRRGSRYQAVEQFLPMLTGAEAALVVNNNAAAVLLALSELASGGEALVSRGELVEIGGSFRIPDIVRQGGARLVEVGATNRTHLADYATAITPETRVVLKVHQSNFRISGFTSAPGLKDLVTLAHDRGLPVLEDIGSGTLVDLRQFGLPHEPTVRESVEAGVDLVTFSGDKLLGGPQAGLIVGRRDLVDRLKRHPLLRAVRIDKFGLAALEATLKLYLDPARALCSLPVLRMIAQSRDQLSARADRLAGTLATIADLEVGITDGVGEVGGGSLPGIELPTRLVTVRCPSLSAAELTDRLRAGRPAVIGRLTADRFAMDMLTVADDAVDEIADAFRRMFG